MKIKCISCKSAVVHCIDLGKIPLVNEFRYNFIKKKYPLSMGVCKTCRLFQIEKNISPKKIFTQYSHLSGASQTNIKHLKNVYNFIIKKKKISSKSKILEIGCNDGSLLKILNKKTNNIVGVDPAKNLVKNIKGKYLELISDFFNRKIGKYLISKYSTFDVIVALNVIPHTTNLKEILDYVGKLLNKNGIFIMEGAYFFETIFKGKFDTIYHEHVSSFTVFSLKNVLEKAGLKINYAKKIETQGGSLRIIAKKNYKSDQWKELFSREIRQGVNQLKTYKKVSKSINFLIKKIRNKFKFFSKENKKIIFLGAPARGVVIANIVNFNKKNLLYAIDDSITKLGKFFPGYKVKVISWQELKNYTANFNFILLSWNYKKEILKKVKKFFKKRTKIFIPLPYPKIIKLN
jgi:2-polyprenyl-3-methyl-5-hydroxy-6-metoxy-1,4-benzoquinol methylase